MHPDNRYPDVTVEDHALPNLLQGETPSSGTGPASPGVALFGTELWRSLCEAVSPEPVQVVMAEGFGRIAVPVFRFAGARIGYLGFPVTPGRLANAGHRNLRAFSRSIAREYRLDVVRINQTCDALPSCSFTTLRPEAWIEDLPAWSPASKRLRRDLAFATHPKRGTQLVDGLSHAAEAHAIYLETVRRNSGSARYPVRYFHRLARVEDPSGRLRVFSALASGKLAGFAVVACDGETGHYLHAGASQAGKANGVGDLLLDACVRHAASVGCRRFSLMSSPWEQTGLIAFKHKWGTARRYAVTTDLGFGPVGRIAALGLRMRSAGERRRALRVLQSPDVRAPA